MNIKPEDIEQLLKASAADPATASLMQRFNRQLAEYPLPSSYLALRWLALEAEEQLFPDANDGQREAIRKFYDGYLSDTMKAVPIGADDELSSDAIDPLAPSWARRWITLEEGNDWNTLYYAPRGHVLTSDGYAKHGRGVKLQLGKLYLCRFPSGLELDCRLVAHREVTISTGHGDAVGGSVGTQYPLYLEREFEGVPWRTPLTSVEISLSPGELNAEGRR